MELTQNTRVTSPISNKNIYLYREKLETGKAHDIELSQSPDDIDRLDSIPGIATRMAEQILSEIGTDVKKQFPSAAHMCSWAGLVHGHNESAGKRKSAKTKKGNKYLRTALTEEAHSVRGSKLSRALYRLTAARKGKKRAGIVVAHAMLRISYYLLTRKEMYVDLSEDLRV